jgi:hypothetical protein
LNGSAVTTPNIVVAGSVSEFATVTISSGGQQVGSTQGQTFNFPITLLTGANQFALTATDRAGNKTTLSLTLTLSNGLALVVTSPTNGSTILGSRIYVQGTVPADRPIGVSVNGETATVIGNQFVAAVDLDNGPNTLTVRATAISGETAVATVNVTSDQSVAAPYVLEPSGIAPFPAQISIPDGVFAAIDYDNDGVFDDFAFSGGIYTHTYASPGFYTARILVFPDNNTSYTYLIPVVVLDVRALDAQVRATFTTAMSRLRGGDIEGALQLFTPGAADRYRPVFQELGCTLVSARQRSRRQSNVVYSLGNRPIRS